jgi:hypothetical protein
VRVREKTQDKLIVRVRWMKYKKRLYSFEMFVWKPTGKPPKFTRPVYLRDQCTNPQALYKYAGDRKLQ